MHAIAQIEIRMYTEDPAFRSGPGSPTRAPIVDASEVVLYEGPRDEDRASLDHLLGIERWPREDLQRRVAGGGQAWLWILVTTNQGGQANEVSAVTLRAMSELGMGLRLTLVYTWMPAPEDVGLVEYQGVLRLTSRDLCGESLDEILGIESTGGVEMGERHAFRGTWDRHVWWYSLVGEEFETVARDFCTEVLAAVSKMRELFDAGTILEQDLSFVTFASSGSASIQVDPATVRLLAEIGLPLDLHFFVSRGPSPPSG